MLFRSRENGFDLNKDKYNWEEHTHFITEDCKGDVDFGEGKKNMYALPDTTILRQIDKEVQMAVNSFGEGRGVYISGLPYSFENSRVLYRAILWAAHDEENLHRWFSSNYNVEVHAYVKNGKYCIVNNTYEPQEPSTLCMAISGSGIPLNVLFFHKHDKSSIYEENAIHYPFNGRSVYDCLCCKGTGTDRKSTRLNSSHPK